MKRSAISIPSNIAEGWMRQHTKKYIQFIYHALGSCGELTTQLAIAHDLRYIDTKARDNIQEEMDSVIKMLRGLVKKLKK